MQVDYLIAGQGIAGTLVSYELWRAGRSFVLVDDGQARSASRTAAAVLNPMAGRHWRPSAAAATLIPAALRTYRSLEALLGIALLQAAPLFVFHTDARQQQQFELRRQQFPGCFSQADALRWKSCFSAPYGAGMINRVWLVHAEALLDGWRSFLQQQGVLRAERMEPGSLAVEEKSVHYRDISARKVVFCEGAAASRNPLLAHLPFTANRGDALLLHIPGLPADAVYHRELRLVPRAGNLFWYGSNYRWDIAGLEPDPGWKAGAIGMLETWLKLPFEVAAHWVAERPTTAGQRIFAEIHPRHPAVALLNGLGTRGFSAGPYYAAELVCKLLAQTER